MIRTSLLFLTLLLAVSFADDTIAVDHVHVHSTNSDRAVVSASSHSHDEDSANYKLVVEGDRAVHLRVPNDDISPVYTVVDKASVIKNGEAKTDIKLSLNLPGDLLNGRCGKYTLVVNALHPETNKQVASGEIAEVEVYGRDPCKRHNKKCPLHSICEPTKDKCDFFCLCEAGYRGVGSTDGKPKTCEDIDECKEGTHNCMPGEECVNIEGGYRCVPEGDFYIDLDNVAPGRIFDKNDRQFYQHYVHNNKEKNTNITADTNVPGPLQTKYFEECGNFTISFKASDKEGNEARASRTFQVVHNPEVNQCTLDYNSPPELHKFIARCDPITTDCVAKADCTSECVCKPGLKPIFEKGKVTKCVCESCVLKVPDVIAPTQCIVCEQITEPTLDSKFLSARQDIELFDCKGKKVTPQGPIIASASLENHHIENGLENYYFKVEYTASDGVNFCTAESTVTVPVEDISYLVRVLKKEVDVQTVSTGRLNHAYYYGLTILFAILFVVLWNLLPEILHLLRVLINGANVTEDEYTRAYRFLYRYTLCCSDQTAIDRKIYRQWVLLNEER